MTTERVFFVGGTGNIGAKAVQGLLEKNIAVTLYARNASKVESLFPAGAVNVVQGDYSDLSALKEGIQGHTRLFLLIADLSNLAGLKREIANIAYEAGVKQVLDISSESVNWAWRKSYIGALHYEAERAMYDIPNRGKFVVLRPTRFMSNLFTFDRPTANGLFFDTADANQKQGWISTNDIGAAAAVVLSDDINDHGDSVYSMVGDALSPGQRAEILSRVAGREYTFKKIAAVQKFNKLTELNMFPRYIASDLCSGLDDHEDAHVSNIIPILLGREPETFEEFVTANKNAIFGN
jgi:uncharacterized protein YbjT (DUF2867 family)